MWLRGQERLGWKVKHEENTCWIADGIHLVDCLVYSSLMQVLPISLKLDCSLAQERAVCVPRWPVVPSPCWETPSHDTVSRHWSGHGVWGLHWNLAHLLLSVIAWLQALYQQQRRCDISSPRLPSTISISHWPDLTPNIAISIGGG